MIETGEALAIRQLRHLSLFDGGTQHKEWLITTLCGQDMLADEDRQTGGDNEPTAADDQPAAADPNVPAAAETNEEEDEMPPLPGPSGVTRRSAANTDRPETPMPPARRTTSYIELMKEMERKGKVFIPEWGQADIQLSLIHI